MTVTAARKNLPSVKRCRPTNDRIVCSTAAPDPTLVPAGYTLTETPYPEAVNADIQRYTIHHCPTVDVEGLDSPDTGTRLRAKRSKRAREDNLRRVAGTIETRIGQVGVWVAFRPDRRTAPFSRVAGEYPFANLAVREIIRLDRQTRK